MKHFIKHRTRGFTLIELLVVIAIIGILSSVVVASLNSARTKARDARRVSDIKQIQVALELYYDTVGQYPTALSSLTTATNGGTLAKEPKDPQSDVSYFYAYKSVSGKVTAYHVAANLEATKTGTTLDDGDTDLPTNPVPTGWTAVSPAGGIAGDDDDDCSNTTGSTVMCFDISNVSVVP